MKLLNEAHGWSEMREDRPCRCQWLDGSLTVHAAGTVVEPEIVGRRWGGDPIRRIVTRYPNGVVHTSFVATHEVA